jgi:hypothetical protein
MKNDTKILPYIAKELAKEFIGAGAMAGALIGLLIPFGTSIAGGLFVSSLVSGAIAGGLGTFAAIGASVAAAYVGFKVGLLVGASIANASVAIGRKAVFGTFKSEKAKAIVAQRADDNWNNCLATPAYETTPLRDSFKNVAQKFRRLVHKAPKNNVSGPKL